MLFGSAVKGLQATGAVPELTAEEQEVVAAAQHEARAAAGQAAQHASLASGGGKDKGKGKAATAGGNKGKEAAESGAAAPASAGGLIGEYAELFGIR